MQVFVESACRDEQELWATAARNEEPASFAGFFCFFILFFCFMNDSDQSDRSARGVRLGSGGPEPLQREAATIFFFSSCCNQPTPAGLQKARRCNERRDCGQRSRDRSEPIS